MSRPEDLCALKILSMIFFFLVGFIPDQVRLYGRLLEAPFKNYYEINIYFMNCLPVLEHLSQFLKEVFLLFTNHGYLKYSCETPLMAMHTMV